MRPCEEYEDLISAFIDGVLPEADRERLMEHMASCPACQAYFDDQVAIHDAFVHGEAPAPERLASAVMAQVCSTPQRAKRKPILLRWQSYAALAACCALVVLGLWRFRNWQKKPPCTFTKKKICRFSYSMRTGAKAYQRTQGI